MESDPEKEERLLKFLDKHRTAALATISKSGKAHCSTVYCFADARFTFYFVTKKNSRKVVNLAGNKSAALAISDEKSLQTVQVDGQVTMVTNAAELAEVVTRLKVIQYGRHQYENPPINKLYGSFVFYKLLPTWIRWVDYKGPWTETSIYECVFDS